MAPDFQLFSVSRKDIQLTFLRHLLITSDCVAIHFLQIQQKNHETTRATFKIKLNWRFKFASCFESSKKRRVIVRRQSHVMDIP